MKTKILFPMLILLFCCTIKLYAQLDDPVIFEDTWVSYSTVKCADGNYATVSETSVFASPDSLKLTKFEADGDILWHSVFARNHLGNVRLFNLPDGGYAVFDYEYYFRLDAAGTLLLEHEITPADLGYTPIPGDDGDCNLAGVTQNATGFQIFTEGHASAPTNSFFRVLTQIDADAYAVWSYATLEESLYTEANLVNIDEETYIIYSDYYDESTEMWIVDNITGAFSKYPFSDDFTSQIFNNMQKVTGGIVSAATKISFSEPVDVISKFNTDGDILWSREYSYFNTDSIGKILGIAELPGGNLISLNKVPRPFTFYETDYVLRRYTAEGDSIWQSPVLFSYPDFIFHDFALKGDNLVFTGEQNFAGDHSGFVLVTDTLGNFFTLSVEGYVYRDENANGVIDPGEVPVANQIIYTSPDTLYTVTDASGKYHMNLFETGVYDLHLNLPMYWDLMDPASYSITFDESVAGTTLTDKDFRLDYTEPVTDVETTVLNLGAMFPGFFAESAVIVNNFGNQAADAGSVYFHHASSLSYTGGTPYEEHTDTMLTYHYNALNPYANYIAWIYFDASTDLESGDSVRQMGYTVPAAEDIDPLNNYDTIVLAVSASLDPNHKTVSPAGTGEEGFIFYETEWLTYTIEFQNIGTAPAHFVYVVDTLDALLDMMSMQMIGAKYNYTMEVSSPGVVTWKFDDINLPDSLSDPEGSTGFICFRIKIKDAATIGDLIENTAAIYFDYNAPVITNTTKSTLSDLTEVIDETAQTDNLHIYPNPVNGTMINITADENLQHANWKIIDMTGKVICTGILNDAVLQIPGTIKLSPQQYILTIITDKNILNTAFVIMQ